MVVAAQLVVAEMVASCARVGILCGQGALLQADQAVDELEDGKNAPAASNITDIKVENGDFTDLIVLDMDSYAAKCGSSAVRKNCTIPFWLNAIAEKRHVNFSKTLQEALINQLGL